MRRVITWFTLFCFVTSRSVVLAGPHEEGTAAGQAANPLIRATIDASKAAANVPGYTTTPPESSYYAQPGLTGPANTRLAACLDTPEDPVCQALRGAVSSANTARPALSPYDPSVAAARDITRNPSNVLGSLASYYAGCRTAEVTTPANATDRLCLRYSGIGNYTTGRDLTVQVELQPSCEAGSWFAHAQASRNGTDVMVAEAQCRIRADGRQRLRFQAIGAAGACVDWQTVELPTTPSTSAAFVADLAPNWSGSCVRPFKVMVVPGSGCSAGQCRYQFRFGTPVYRCPSGSSGGDSLLGYWGGDVLTPGSAEQCFSLTAPNQDTGCQSAGATVYASAGMQCATPAGDAILSDVAGWTVPLAFLQPTMLQHETDQWIERHPALDVTQQLGRCIATSAERCVDGPSTRLIDGRPVKRLCWSFESTLSCAGGAPVDECAPLVSAGCTPSGSSCRQTDPATGRCQISQDSYRCPAPAQTFTTASNCPANVYCLGASCFNTSAPPDADFARSMSLLEAAREAGVYLDPNLMQVFKGEADVCRERLLQNCCAADASGAGMTNQSLFSVGSRLVYDVLMNAENRQFIVQGMQALLLSGGFSGSFTSYGVTVAINGTALPAGSVVLHAGDNVVVAVDPWSLAIAVTLYAVMSMLSCGADEARLALKEGAGLCHSVGSWCSSCIRVFGACVSCIEHKTGKCCFNSKLARIINEQGRQQVGKGWGDAQNPDCSGFTVAQLQRLDFAAMDLSEFYASIVPTLPDVAALQGRSSTRLPDCYYGQGRCQ